MFAHYLWTKPAYRGEKKEIVNSGNDKKMLGIQISIYNMKIRIYIINKDFKNNLFYRKMSV